MTQEEKLALIRVEMEKSYCHYAHLSYEGFKSTYVLEREAIYKDLIDYIDKIIAEDEDYVPHGYDNMDEDVLAAARKIASGINYSTMTTTEIYIKGFNSGQYWRQNNPKWKPTDEQLRTVHTVATNPKVAEKYTDRLMDLYFELKKQL